YPLIGGGHLPTIAADPGLYPPSSLAGRFDRQSPFVSTYLHQGNATSSEEFGFLLDELNAYSHDLHAAVGLQPLASPARIVFVNGTDVHPV
ncbi:MAG: hypothetical protein MUC59_10390, partial [Saprospiraceae bacterium]|nr:hypothetical protein [Saprospiraceae bacterium]